MSVKLEEQLCFEVYKAASHFNKLYTRALAPFDLTYSQYLVLMTLWDEEALMTKAVGEKLGLGIGTLNPIVSKLEKRGWVIKEASPVDKRVTLIALSVYGKAQKQKIEEAILQQLQSCTDLLALEPNIRHHLRAMNDFFEKYYK